MRTRNGDKIIMGSMKAKSSFKLTTAKEVAFSEVEGGPKLTKGYFEMDYIGELQGIGVLQELKCYMTDSAATVYGFERITGRVGTKSGSFVLEHAGKFEEGILTSKRTVVQDSGTGELTGIFGEINFESGNAEEFTIVLNYDFEYKFSD